MILKQKFKTKQSTMKRISIKLQSYTLSKDTLFFLIRVIEMRVYTYQGNATIIPVCILIFQFCVCTLSLKCLYYILFIEIAKLNVIKTITKRECCTPICAICFLFCQLFPIWFVRVLVLLFVKGFLVLNFLLSSVIFPFYF